ncbi:hypothetical protein [Vibrio owensii]|uniref:hypothetical protein n=1 Tax=Vibrio owensii TaxID=696485 RepID=UPI0018F236F1|nr:hypothetical protein [Vibrio owensii]
MHTLVLFFIFAIPSVSYASGDGLVPTQPGRSLPSVWDAMWPGTWSQISNLSENVVGACFLAFAAWVAVGLYRGVFLTGRLGTGDAFFIFMRLLVLMLALFSMVNAGG